MFLNQEKITVKHPYCFDYIKKFSDENMKTLAILFCKHRDFNYEEVMAFLKFCEGRDLIDDASLSLINYLNCSDNMSCEKIIEVHSCSNHCYECAYSNKYSNGNSFNEKLVLSYLLANPGILSKLQYLNIDEKIFGYCKVFNNQVFHIYKEIFNCFVTDPINFKENLIKKYSRESVDAQKCMDFSIDDLLEYNSSEDDFKQALELLKHKSITDDDKNIKVNRTPTPVNTIQGLSRQKAEKSFNQYDFSLITDNYEAEQLLFFNKDLYPEEKKKEVKLVTLNLENSNLKVNINDKKQARDDVELLQDLKSKTVVTNDISNFNTFLKKSSTVECDILNPLSNDISIVSKSKQKKLDSKSRSDIYEYAIFNPIDTLGNTFDKNTDAKLSKYSTFINIVSDFGSYKKIHNEISIAIMILVEYFEDSDELLLSTFRFGKYGPLYLINLKDKDIVTSLMQTFNSSDYIKISYDTVPLTWRMLQEKIMINNYFSIKTAYSIINFNKPYKTKKEVINEIEGIQLPDTVSIKDEVYLSIKRYQNIYKHFMKKEFNTNTLNLFNFESKFNKLLASSYKPSDEVLNLSSSDGKSIASSYTSTNNKFFYTFLYDSIKSRLIHEVNKEAVYLETCFLNIDSYLSHNFETSSTSVLGYIAENDLFTVIKNEIYRIVCIEMIDNDFINKCDARLVSINDSGLVFSSNRKSLDVLIDFVNHIMRNVAKKYLKNYRSNCKINIR
ncbi:hypothetical protein [Wukongibacter baidiensis]